jgi:GNAT superfamily N-acetyltransferase
LSSPEGSAGGGRTGQVSIRPAQRADVPLLFSLVRELADYERAPEAVTGSEELLSEALFGERPAAEALIAEIDGQAAGFALFFQTFSTWLCRRGLWLEDLYVSPSHRGSGVGGALLGHLARTAVQRGCGRIEWAVLEWNTPAVSFYARLGAERLDEWRVFRLSGESLARLGGGSTPGS